jgi:hypothetical protein
MLRGPQTPGELRSRADRLYTFDDLATVQSTLERLAARNPSDEATNTGPLTTILPRQPGSREARYAHLLGAPPDLSPARYPAQQDEPAATHAAPPTTQRLTQVETQLASLSEAILALQVRVDHLEADRLEAGQPPPNAAPADRL